MVYGAIIGDIAGSRFEFNNHRSKDFEIFSKDCFFTDDTLMTIAVATALELDKRNGFEDLGQTTIDCMQIIGRPYPNAGWGGNFGRWLYSEDPKPYFSFGNGAAMRVSACGWYGTSLADTLLMAKQVTEISHDHPEGLKGAMAVAALIYMARKGYSRCQMKELAGVWYDLDFKLDDIRATYKFNETCQDTVPQAIVAFLESNSFEDAIRNAVSVGGDSDTLAAITGSIAEAFYGVPEEMKRKAMGYLDSFLKPLVEDAEKSLLKRI